jgi:flagellar hook-associated protein 2
VANAVSGVGQIDVATLVNQLMTAEGNTQKLLQKQQSKAQSTLSAFQSMNTNVKAVQTAAETMITSVLSPKTWAVNTVTASSTSVSGTATASATPGSYSFDVLSVATAHKELYTSAVSSTANVGGGTMTITQGGTSVDVDLSAATTMTDVVAAINKTTGLGVKASAVQVGTNSFRLQLAASSAGAAGQFTVAGTSAALGAPSVIATGVDTQVKFGPGANDIATSTTNTVSNLFSGMSFTVTKPETGVVLTVGQDTATMSTQVSTLVSAVNKALAGITSGSAYNQSTKAGGPLLGEQLPSSIADKLTSTLFASSGASLTNLGISLNSTGSLVFDSAKFTTAMGSDAAGTISAIQAFATRLGTSAKAASDYATGSITTAVQTRQSLVTSLGKQITDWDTKLSAKQAQLTKQYSQLNTQLSQMASQASWLSGQFASMASGTTTG